MGAVDRDSGLADFLRSRRARIGPADVGLPSGTRRRTPGLRREEVAQLAAVSPTWYTWLEQGRDVRPSVQVLESLVDVLRLDADERAYLFQMARGETPPNRSAGHEEVPEYLERLVRHLDPTPAYITNRRLDVLAWNATAAAILGDFGQVPVQRRNSVWLVFTDPYRRELLEDWEGSAQHLVAQLRAASGHYVGDPGFAALVDALTATSPEFRAWWPNHEVEGRGSGRKVLNHPEAGRMVFDHSTFTPGDAAELRLVIYTPTDQETSAKLTRVGSS